MVLDDIGMLRMPLSVPILGTEPQSVSGGPHIQVLQQINL